MHIKKIYREGTKIIFSCKGVRAPLHILDIPVIAIFNKLSKVLCDHHWIIYIRKISLIFY